MQSEIHRSILKRLLVAWLSLAVVIGVSVYFVEHSKIEDLAVNLAVEYSQALTDEHILSIYNQESERNLELQEIAGKLTLSQFAAVDIYDNNGHHLAESSRYKTTQVKEQIENRHHQFPLDKKFHHEKFDVEGDVFIQVLLPLKINSGDNAGYFEGVYHVQREALGKIDERIYYGLSLAVLVSLLTSIVLYPIILRLNKDLFGLSANLLDTNIELLEVLGCAIASRDSSTNSHNYRVTLYAVKLGEALGLKNNDMQNLIVGSFLHDVGKIGVADDILKKPDKLTDAERIEMQKHVSMGVDIVSRSNWLSGAQDVIEYHHEKYDGTGYSMGLKGDEIPVIARVFSVVDVFDALASTRPYKGSMSIDQCITYLKDNSGNHFDPEMVEQFSKIAEKQYAHLGELVDGKLTAEFAKTIKKYFYTTKRAS
ncbi:MAG: HD-GYP domain-containing protein [Gammaproteobacteria bacterium]|nr:HD-GYP domain-containing protein [Gammaproteobacteria bacterium]